MKRIIGFLVLCVIALPLASASASTTAASQSTAVRNASPWRLVVDDRFNSGGVPRHWSRYDGPYGSGAENCARPDHASVKDGAMRIVLRYRSSGDCGAGWYSAGMMLAKRYQAVDQKISVRFRVASTDGVRGHRIIPMRWPSSGSWPAAGEEDFCESSGLRGCSTFLHHSQGQEYSHTYRVNLTRWHTVTFVRRDFTVRSYIDGKLQWSFRGSPKTLPATLKRPVLQQECSSSCPSGRSGQETIIINWIKVWNER